MRTPLEVAATATRAEGWEIFSSWGESGWDAGIWPYVKVGARELADGKAQSIYYVEGDVTIRTHENLDAAIRHLDGIVLWHWQHEDNGPRDARDYTPETMPERYRRPFNWHRLCVARGEPFCSRCQNAQKEAYHEAWDRDPYAHRFEDVTEGRTELYADDANCEGCVSGACPGHPQEEIAP